MQPDQLSRDLEAVVYRFSVMVRALGRRSGLDESDLDELMQAVRVRLWRALGRQGALPVITSSYVYQTAQSAVVDIVRSRRCAHNVRNEGFRALEEPSAPHSPDASLEQHEATRRIFRVVDQLPADRRAAVRLHLHGYRREEIARMLRWSGTRTRNLLYRGLEDTRRKLTLLGLAPVRTGLRQRGVA
jgi:RNA polymerase sigma factor (sigma-70 family)